MANIIQSSWKKRFLPAAIVVAAVWALSLVSSAKADEPLTLSEADWGSLSYTRFSDMQAVNSSGTPQWTIPLLESPAYDPDYPQAYKLRGVVLNDPAKMLNSTPGSTGLGGSWQVYLQAVDSTLDPNLPEELIDDFGGVALWMAQNYAPMHGGNTAYNATAEAWLAEIGDLNRPIDMRTGERVTDALRPGDLIEVRARGALHNKGKYNCNEEHTNAANRDFEIFILDRDLPIEPAAIQLDDVLDEDNVFLFDSTRTTGPEFLQAQYVTLENVEIVADSGTWTTYGGFKVTDGTREFDVKLGYNTVFADAAMPSGPITITGIFDQESVDNSHLTSGYRMWALSPSDFAPAVSLAPGDANGDGAIDADDLARLAAHWGDMGEVSWFDGDFNGDARVNAADAALLAANWSHLSESDSSVPEPATATLLLIALTVSVACRRRNR